MIKGFEFQEGGRHYTCTVEAMSGPDAEQWWWFAVSGDQQRYAPFRAERSDTRASVQERVVAFYTNRLYQLAQPRERGGHFGSRKRPVTPTGDAAKPTAQA
jgi:hypothetical protein